MNAIKNVTNIYDLIRMIEKNTAVLEEVPEEWLKNIECYYDTKIARLKGKMKK